MNDKPPNPLKRVNLGKLSRQWVKDMRGNLKPSFKTDFGDGSQYCMKYHKKELVCPKKAESFCKIGALVRVHTCVCGIKHPMHSCKKIFK